VVDLLVLLAISPLIVLGVFWSLELLIGLVPGRTGDESEAGSGCRIAVLIPAHNEQAGIGPTLDRLSPQLGPSDRVLVVADNCTDDTADIARTKGAQVLVRVDRTRRGKGYALDAGVKQLGSWERPPDVVVVLDADCWFEHDRDLARLGSRALATSRPQQARDELVASERSSPGERLARFAFLVKNSIRPLALRRLGAPCLLTGTGMAIPWRCIEAVDLASGDIVEDMRLGIDLAIAGFPPCHYPSACVLSEPPNADRARVTQRTRWEQGHLRSIASHAPRLVRTCVRRPRLAVLALELCVPPLSSLVLLLVGGAVLLAMLWLIPGLIWQGWSLSVLPLAAILGTLAIASGSLLVAWAVRGRGILSAGDLLAIPWYALGKLPIYLHLLRGGERTWVRTER